MRSHGPDLGLAELARLSGLPKPTARRIAEDLVRRRLLVRDAGGYALGPRLPEMAQDYERHRRFAVVRPVLAELGAQFGGYVWFSGGPQQSEFVLTGVVAGEGHDKHAPKRWPVGRTPEALVNTAAGRVVLAQRPDIVEHVTRAGWQPATAHSPATPEQLHSALRQVRDQLRP